MEKGRLTWCGPDLIALEFLNARNADVIVDEGVA